MLKKVFDVIIVGLGPGGIALGVELSKSNLSFLIIEKGMPGGKVNIAPRVDNYPNHDKIDGPSLAMELFQKAQQSKLPIEYNEVTKIEKSDNQFIVDTLDDSYVAKNVVVASGTKEKKLGLPHEDELLGNGLSYCALCDGHFYRGLDVAVIGGGNSAFKEAIHLAKIVKNLYLIHRRKEFRAEQYLVDELKENANVKFLTPAVVDEFLIKDNHLIGLLVRNLETNKVEKLMVQGVFPLVGQNPNTEFIKIASVLDEYRNMIVDKETCKTPIEGLYAIGDVTNYPTRQIYIAENDAKVVARDLLNKLSI